MANYYASARTNYFKVRDAAAFRKMAKRFRLTLIEKDGLFGLLPGDWTDSGEFPSYDPDLEEQGLEGEIDFVKLLSEHLAEGSVAVVVEAGAEKLRYVVGRAVAVNHRGETVVVDLQDIYAEAAAAFGAEPTRAEY